MHCAYENMDFPDVDFELHPMGMLHKGVDPAHTANGDLVHAESFGSLPDFFDPPVAAPPPPEDFQDPA